MADVIIIGAGAAGLMCAIGAARRGRSVMVLEKGLQPAQKIRISGGGRCNFTNIDVRAQHYLSENPRFCISALKRFQPKDFIAMVEAAGIEYYEKTLGQLFCKGSAQQIIDMLLRHCGDAGVKLNCGVEVASIEKQGKDFVVASDKGEFRAASLVIASGGPSVPKMGSSGFAYEVARQFGLDVIEPRPGLVPLAFDHSVLERLKGLTGLSCEVEVKSGKKKFREAMLFTHRGLSGPAILQISSYWQPGSELEINFAPDTNGFEFLRQARDAESARKVINIVGTIMPRNLAGFLCGEAGIEGNIGPVSNRKLQQLADLVNRWRIKPVGTEGYRTAEVTVGGVDTRQLSSKSLEVGKVPGLYFIGEAVDVTGQLGGYNFQWAWASGHAAGSLI